MPSAVVYRKHRTAPAVSCKDRIEPVFLHKDRRGQPSLRTDRMGLISLRMDHTALPRLSGKAVKLFHKDRISSCKSSPAFSFRI